MSTDSSLQAGTACADISPPAYTAMTGMGTNRPRPRGVHDRLRAKAMVLKSGDQKVALVTADINYIAIEHVDEVRRLVAKYTDVPPANVRVTSSHSHSSPGYFALHAGDQPAGWWGGITDEETDHAAAACRLIAGAVYEANLKLQDAEIGFGEGRCRHNIIRWHRTADGKMMYTPHHRDELEPNLPPLDDIFIMHVRHRGSAQPLATYYTNHAHAICVCLQSDLISADYPGFVAEVVESKLGGLCMFAPGAIGDQHPRDFDRGYDAARQMGYQIADEVLAAVAQMRYSSDVQIRTVRSPAVLPNADAKGTALRTRTELSALAINGVAFSFWPGEPFGMISTALQRESPFNRTVLVANTDDFKYYFALEKEYGKYQWERTGAGPTIYPVAAGDQLYARALADLKSLKSQP